MNNEEKAREIANNCSTEIIGAEVSDETYITTEPDCYNAAYNGNCPGDIHPSICTSNCRPLWADRRPLPYAIFFHHLLPARLPLQG